MAEDLFVRPDGRPMTFLMSSSREKKQVKASVEERGGVVVSHASPSTADHLIRLVVGNEMPPSRHYDMFHYKYILDCVKDNRLLPDLKSYKQASTFPSPYAAYEPIDVLLGKVCWNDVPPNGEAISDVEEDDIGEDDEREAGTSTSKAFKTSRSAYTAPERAEIVEELVKREAYEMLKGNAIWKALEKEGVCRGRRSWQSLKEQFRKAIAPEIGSYGLDQNELDKFKAALGEPKKSNVKSTEASKYPAVSEGGSRRKSKDRREPPSSPRRTAAASGSGWMGKSSKAPQIPGNPRLSVSSTKKKTGFASPSQKKTRKSVANSTTDSQEMSENGYVTASQDEEEPSGNHFYDIIPKSSTPNRSLVILEANPIQLSPRASRSRASESGTHTPHQTASQSPQLTGSIATVVERTKRRTTRSKGEPSKKKLRRKSKVGEIFAETPVKAASPSDESEVGTSSRVTDLDDTALSSQEVTVVGDGVQFDSERIVEDEIDTSSHRAESSVSNQKPQRARKESKKTGKRGKRATNISNQGQEGEDSDEQNKAEELGNEDNKVVEKRRGEKQSTTPILKLVASVSGKTASKRRKGQKSSATKTIDGEGEEDVNDVEPVTNKSAEKNSNVKRKIKVEGGMFRQPYSKQEETSVINYLLEKGGLSLIGGLKLWQEMVEAEVCPGRSAQALKEQFLNHIRKRLHEFDVTEAELREADTRADSLTAYISHNESLGGSPSGRGFRDKANYYTTEEDLKILGFILDNGRSADTGGVSLWQLMEYREVVEGRSWQSMKERFRKSILKRIDSFTSLTADQKQRLLVGGGGNRGKGGRKKKDAQQ